MLLSVDSDGTVSTEDIPPPPVIEVESSTSPLERNTISAPTLSVGHGVVYAVQYETQARAFKDMPWVSVCDPGPLVVHSLDLATLEWHRIEDQPYEYEKVIEFRQRDGRERCEPMRFTQKAIRPTPRLGPMCACVDGNLMLLGGLSRHVTHNPQNDERVGVTEVLDGESERWTALEGDLSEQDLGNNRCYVRHDGVLYTRGSRDMWVTCSAHTGMSVEHWNRPGAFIPRHLVSVGRYILMLSDMEYAVRIREAGYPGGDRWYIYDVVTSVYHLLKPLPFGEFVTGGMITPSCMLLVHKVEETREAPEHQETLLLELTPEMVHSSMEYGP
ncbi:hypothetical protein KIPB_000489 [Kipferlia bialata]|uniref:Kelch-type beta propeller n=1 Tax=Kipferlia bialata TaxID=797122 RepID=A0A9K3CP36_9EUKA|nr:hypothetical protein KIPB_000489 [Kipferlia bialata]|eukprot:g489.t1